MHNGIYDVIIEMQYGEALEAYPGWATVNGKEVKVDYLMFGRIALVYQTLDETSGAYWNNESKAWMPLSDSYRIYLRKAIKIAKRQANDDLIVLPVKAATPAGSAK